MSDHDRGAYTPQTDPPLAFDPRRPSERRPLPMALIGSAVVLVVLLAGVAMVYRGGVREAGQSPRPVGEPVMAVKTAPIGPAVAQTPAADAPTQPPAAADVYTPANQTAEAPTMAPAPEQPAARPQPSAATVALLSKPPAPTHVVRPAPVAEAVAPAEAAKAVAKPVRPKVDQTELAAATGGGHATRVETSRTETTQTASSQTPAAPAGAAGIAAAPAKPMKVASTATPRTAASAAAPAPTPAAAPGGAAVVQIGAFSSTALADKGYADVSAAAPGRMGGKAKHVLALQKDGGTLYRTWISGFGTRADAVSFCEALKAKGLACFVKGV